MKRPQVRDIGRIRALAARRRAAAGFTLIELMVVVILISMLAVIATPAMKGSRDDRIAFNYARQYSQIIHRARTRAAGRGSAHLIVGDPGTANRGRILLFEALDGTAAAAGGPNPVSSCRTPNQWNDVTAFVPGAVSANARIIDGLDLNSAGVNVDADIKSAFTTGGAATPAFALCVTPGGNSYVGVGADFTTAIADMVTKPVFSDVVEIDVARHSGASVVGLTRAVLVAGASAPRIRSR